MAGLDPAIRALHRQGNKTWMPGTRPGMTVNVSAALHVIASKAKQSKE
jgi:hypothetical protein